MNSGWIPKRSQIKLFEIILYVMFLYQINLKIGFYLIFDRSSSNYDTGIYR